MNSCRALDRLASAIRGRLERSDLAAWHSAVRVSTDAIVVLYRKPGDGRLYGQLFDRSFFSAFSDESVESLAATIVANELEPPHGRGALRDPPPIDASLLPTEPIFWIAL